MNTTTTLHTYQVGDRVALADDDGLVPHMYEIGQEGIIEAQTGVTLRVKWDKGGESHLAPWRLEKVIQTPGVRYHVFPGTGAPYACHDCGTLVWSKEVHDQEAHWPEFDTPRPDVYHFQPAITVPAQVLGTVETHVDPLAEVVSYLRDLQKENKDDWGKADYGSNNYWRLAARHTLLIKIISHVEDLQQGGCESDG